MTLVFFHGKTLSVVSFCGCNPEFTQSRQPGLKLILKKDSIFWIVTLVFATSYNPKKGTGAMKVNVIIDQEMQKVKIILDGSAGIVGQNLTADDGLTPK